MIIISENLKKELDGITVHNLSFTVNRHYLAEKRRQYMKATGIVRRIDDLGRVVIPKEIRKTMRIREGQAMEIFTGREGDIVLKKYSPIEEMAEDAAEYAKALSSVCGHLVCVSDQEQIVAASGPDQKNYLGKSISPELEDLLANRQSIDAPPDSRSSIPLLQDQSRPSVHEIVVPILSSGDVLGAVILIGKNDTVKMGEAEKMLAKVAALFLGTQME